MGGGCVAGIVRRDIMMRAEIEVEERRDERRRGSRRGKVVGGGRLGEQSVLRTTTGGRETEDGWGVWWIEGGRRLGGVGPGLGRVTGSATRGWVTGHGKVEAKRLLLRAALRLNNRGSGQPNRCRQQRAQRMVGPPLLAASLFCQMVRFRQGERAKTKPKEKAADRNELKKGPK